MVQTLNFRGEKMPKMLDPWTENFRWQPIWTNTIGNLPINFNVKICTVLTSHRLFCNGSTLIFDFEYMWSEKKLLCMLQTLQTKYLLKHDQMLKMRISEEIHVLCCKYFRSYPTTRMWGKRGEFEIFLICGLNVVLSAMLTLSKV